MFTLELGNNVSLVAKLHSRHGKKDWLDKEWFTEKGFTEEALFEVFRVTPDSEILIGHTFFSPFPGCCGIVVSHGTYLTEKSRHSGLSDPFRKLKENIARECGYTCMVATTQMSNIPAVGNFFKSRYKFVQTFTNKRTGNLLGVGMKIL